jgi:hypothetical protein
MRYSRAKNKGKMAQRKGKETQSKGIGERADEHEAQNPAVRRPVAAQQVPFKR